MSLQEIFLELLYTTDVDADVVSSLKGIKYFLFGPGPGSEEGEEIVTTTDELALQNPNTFVVNTCMKIWNAIITSQLNCSTNTSSSIRFFIVKVLEGSINNNLPINRIQLHKLVLITARCLLDCNQIKRAEECLLIVSRLMEKLKAEINESKCETAIHDFHKHNFILNVYSAEVYVKLKRSEEAFNAVKKNLNMIVDDDHQVYLIQLCYNFGLETFNQGSYEDSVNWLRISLSCGKQDNKSLDHSKTLTLLAEVYLKWDAMLHWEKAKHALELLDKYGSTNPFLMLRCVLSGNVPIEELEMAVRNCIIKADASDKDRYKVLAELLEHGRTMVAATMMNLFETVGDPSNRGQFVLFYVKCLLSKEKTDDAKLLLQHFCTMNSDVEMDGKYKKELCALTIEQAAGFQDQKKYTLALDWYCFSCHFLEKSSNSAMFATIARNKCFCFLQENNILTASKELQKLKDSGFVFECVDWYLNFKISVLGGDFANALLAFQELDKHKAIELLCVATQDILASGDTKNIVTVLEKLCSVDNVVIRLAVCKLLIHVHLTTSNEISNDLLCMVTTYMNMAYEVLCQCIEDDTVQSDDLKDHAKWFAKLAWNLALLNSGNVGETHMLFALSSRFLASCATHDPSTIIFQQMVLMMVAASGLTFARLSEKDTKHSLCEKVVEAVSECQNIEKQQIKQGSASQLSKMASRASFSKLLLLYKFEAHAWLNRNAEEVFEELVALPHADAKVFERMAIVAKNCGSKYVGITMRSLKMAISQHLETEQPNNIKIAQLYRSLINIALEEFDVRTSGSDDSCWEFVKGATDLVCGCFFAYPEMEAVWLICKTWNVGVEFLMASKQVEAKRWLEIAFQSTKALPNSTASYQDKMAAVLNEIINV